MSHIKELVVMYSLTLIIKTRSYDFLGLIVFKIVQVVYQDGIVGL